MPWRDRIVLSGRPESRRVALGATPPVSVNHFEPDLEDVFGQLV